MIAFFVMYMHFAGLWAYITGYYARYLVLVLFTFITFVTFNKAKHLTFLSVTKITSKFGLCCKIFIVFILLFINMSILFSFFYNREENTIDLAFPLKNGTYYIAHVI